MDVIDVLPDCLDLSGFDPLNDPSQVVVSTGSRAVSWDPVKRELVVHPLPYVTDKVVTITVSGIRAGPETQACCNEAKVKSCRFERPSVDPETMGSTCTRFVPPGCSPLPGSVTGVKAVRQGQDVVLTWDPPTDSVTNRYHVWKVVNQDAAVIPDAYGETAQADPTAVKGVCYNVTVAARSCTDPAAAPPGSPPPLAFYQVRGVCSNGVEGAY
jgi:hypothetical protein